MRNENGVKLGLAFVAVMIVGFVVGLYVLGPLFSHRPPKPLEVRQPDHPSSNLLASADQNAILRRDVDSVPEHTTVVIEPLTRPAETVPTPPPDISTPSQPKPSPSPPARSPAPPQPEPPAPSPEPENVAPQPNPAPPTPSDLPPPTSGERRYRVRTGVFNSAENADRLMAALAEQGYHPFKVEEKTPSGETRYRVYAGATDDRDSAERLKKELTDKGFAAIVEEVPSGR
jgi:cell division protein FtsN